MRFVQIYSGGMENQRSWDGHSDIQGNHSQFAGETDQPVAALLADLELRGLLDDTLVIWCGEFGRLPVAQKGKAPGRDHNPHCFTAWLAGGGTMPDWPGLDRLSAAREFPARHGAIMLPWNAALDALSPG